MSIKKENVYVKNKHLPDYIPNKDYGVNHNNSGASDLVMDNIQFGLHGSPTTWPMPTQPILSALNSPTCTLSPAQKTHIDLLSEKQFSETKKHSHYFKDVSNLKSIDVYKVLQLFEVTDQALGHAIKKLLVAGGRGAGKSIEKDIQEAIDTLVRCLEIKREVNVQE